MAEPGAVPRQSVVLLIHGTFAFDDHDAPATKARWWQRNGPFHESLQSQLGPEFSVLPAPETSGPVGACESVFHWSGRNSERARRNAARLLLEHLRRFERQRIPYHVVAHSHGGSILWAALVAAVHDQRGRFRKQDPLPSLRTWTTVGTPYLHFVPDFLPVALGVVTALPLIAVLVRQFAWLKDSLTQLPEIADAWPAALIGALYWYLVVFGGTALALFCVYRFFALHSAQRDTITESEIPKIELQRFRQSVWGLLKMAALATAAAWLLNRFHPFFDTLSMAFSDTALMRGAIYGGFGVGGVCLAAGLVLGPILQVFRCRSSANLQIAAWNRFGSRHFSIACHEDEAINGLRAITPGIGGPLLPRISAPGAGQYSPVRHSSKTPEDRPSNANWLLPFLIVRDWLVRPFYNEVVAALLDNFVLRRLTRQSHGADVTGLMLGRVSEEPLLRHEETRRGRRVRDLLASAFAPTDRDVALKPLSRRIGLSEEECRALVRRTSDCAELLLEQLRIQLGVAAPAGTSLRQFFRSAMGEEDASQLLVHTQYFESPEVRSLIAKAIRGEIQTTENSITCSENSSTAIPVEGRMDWPPNGFVFWILRGLTVALLLALPALVLWTLGRAWLYPASRESSIRWAADVPAAFMAAAPHLQILTQDAQSRRSPSFVRWLAALEALGLASEATEFYELTDGLSLPPLDVAALRATVGQKLVEMGERDLGKRQVEIAKAVSRGLQPDSSLPSQIRIDQAERSLQAGQDDDYSNPLGFPPTLQPFRSFVIRLAPATLNSDEASQVVTEITVEVDRLLDQVQEPRELFKAIDALLIVRQRLAELGHFDAAERTLELAKRGCARAAEMAVTGDGDMRLFAIECYVVVAKSHLWPEVSRQSAVVWLREVEQRLTEQLEPLRKLEAKARLAAAYARLGYLARARELAIGAAPRERLLIAKEILANEYEAQTVSRWADDPVRIVVELGRMRRSFDEQVDPARSDINYPR